MAIAQQPNGGGAMPRSPRAAPKPGRRISRPQIAGLAVAALVLVAAAVFAFGRGSQARAGGQAADAQMTQAVPVRAVAAWRGFLSVRTAYSGELVGEVSDISPQVSGLLIDVPARIGQRVAAGTVIAVIADVEVRNQLQEARGQLGVAEANRDRAAAELVGVEADYQRAMELYDQRLLSEQEQQQVSSQYASTKANRA
ncbi:MAG: biotin/lipoyl-binding protein, partial [Holophagales bacterium]|nr:biotin/lipoyl-binding protein [Holophagales bacterium]